MSHIWIVVSFDGFDWLPVAGAEPYVTEAGAQGEAQRLGRLHPNQSFRPFRAGKSFLNRL